MSCGLSALVQHRESSQGQTEVPACRDHRTDAGDSPSAGGRGHGSSLPIKSPRAGARVPAVTWSGIYRTDSCPCTAPFCGVQPSPGGQSSCAHSSWGLGVLTCWSLERFPRPREGTPGMEVTCGGVWGQSCVVRRRTCGCGHRQPVTRWALPVLGCVCSAVGTSGSALGPNEGAFLWVRLGTHPWSLTPSAS